MSLSTMLLGKSPLVAGTTLLQGDFMDVTRYCWPTYRRISSRIGGDVTAQFSFTSNFDVLYEWFSNYLAYQFHEVFDDTTCFLGYIHTMRLRVDNEVLVRSIDNLYNSVAVSHQTISGNNFTSFPYLENKESVATFGRKQAIFPATEIMSLTAADQYAAKELDFWKKPRTFLEDVGLITKTSGVPTTFRRRRAALEVTVRGYASTLDWVLYRNIGSQEYTIPELIIDMLSDIDPESHLPVGGPVPHDYVTPGKLENPVDTWLTIKTDDRPIFERMLEFERITGWAIGCFGSTKLDFFFPYDTLYERQMSGNRLVLLEKGNQVPLPLIKPYGLLYLADWFPENVVRFGARGFADQPNVAQIDSVEYSSSGVKFRTFNGRVGLKKPQLASSRFAVMESLGLLSRPTGVIDEP